MAGAGCAGAERKSAEPSSQPGQTPKLPQAAPVISQSFASPQIAPGRVWKVYLKASDANGDMKEFVCTIQQPGVGTYPVSITRIKEENRNSLSGYLYLNVNVNAFRNLDFVELTLTVQVRDRAGQFSEPVKFPLSINSRYSQEPLPEGVFQETDLGPIIIDLRSVGEDERLGPFDRFRR
jgi:hypothetical protein